MKRPIRLDRPVKILVVAALTALALVSAAGAQSLVGRPPDLRDVADKLAGGGAFVGSTPDVRDVAAARAALPDVLERYAAAHPFGSGIGNSQTAATVIARPPDVADVAASLPAPDVFERYASAHPYGAGASAAIQPTAASRPPDVQDAAQTALTVSLTRPSRFSWGDWAIGIGSGIGIAVLLAGVLGIAMSRQRRQRVLPA
jgi:hypothetical protein